MTSQFCVRSEEGLLRSSNPSSLLRATPSVIPNGTEWNEESHIVCSWNTDNKDFFFLVIPVRKISAKCAIAR